MSAYLVWCPDRDETEGDAAEIDAIAPEFAAETWAEENDARLAFHMSTVEKLRVAVLSPHGYRYEYDVTGVPVMRYIATRTVDTSKWNLFDLIRWENEHDASVSFQRNGDVWSAQVRGTKDTSTWFVSQNPDLGKALAAVMESWRICWASAPGTEESCSQNQEAIGGGTKGQQGEGRR